MLALLKCKSTGRLFHKEDRLIPYLNESINLIKNFDVNKDTLDEAISYIKTSQVEFHTQSHILNRLLSKDSYEIKTVYKRLLKHGIIDDNILFSNLNNKSNFMSIFELIIISKLAKTHNLKIFFFQNGDPIDPQFKFEARQEHPDCLIYLNKTSCRAADVKVGNFKAYSGGNHIFPLFINSNNKPQEILNQNAYESYFAPN
jgi:hypothetical protein